MNNTGIKNAWSALPTAVKLILVVVVLALLFIALNGIGKTVESIRASRFEHKQAAHEKEIAAKDAQIQAAIRQAEIAEAKAQLSEQKAETLEALTKQQGARADAAARKVEDAFNEFEKDTAITGGDVPDDVRRARICQKRKELGFPCAK